MANSYTRTYRSEATGFKNKEGNDSNGSRFLLKETSTTVAANASAIILAKYFAFIPNGYSASDYVHREDDPLTTMKIGDIYTQPEMNVTITRTYVPYDYNITYKMNSGTNSSDNPSTYNVLYGVTFETPSRSGCDFLGWYIDGTKVTGINPGANATFDSASDMTATLASRTIGDVTVEAQWGVNIYFDLNYEGAETYTLPVTLNDEDGEIGWFTVPDYYLIREGYKLLGWAYSPTASSPDLLTGETRVTATSYTYYAVWAPNQYIYIDNGTSWQQCALYLDNGTSWELYFPYIANGTSWDACFLTS